MNNIVLLGHGVGVKFVIESITNNNSLGYSVKGVVTHPFKDHQHDLEIMKSRGELYGEYAYDVFSLRNSDDISLLEANNVNNENVIKWIKKIDPKYIISIGCRNILKETFLHEFKDKVLNIHTTPLPKYRGAASDSWMILNGEWGTVQYGCIHFIDKGIDTGDIIAKEKYIIPQKCYPIDIFKSRMNVYKVLLPKGLKKLEEKGFVPLKQNNDEATTFPRLYAPDDGKLYFSYSSDELIRFIYAFGYPYAGAFCYLNNTKIHILEAVLNRDMSFHPFATGLIFGKDKSGNYKVATKDGYLLIKRIEVHGQVKNQSEVFKLGKRLK